MIVTAHQPSYLPWLGLFHKIALSDYYVFLDIVQYEKNSYINRNKIVCNGEPQWLTVPVQHKGHFDMAINEILINNNVDWRKKHWLSIYFNYKSSPFFKKYSPFLEEIYLKEWLYLSDLTFQMMEWFLEILNIEVKLIKASEANFIGKKNELLIDITKKTNSDLFIFGAMGESYINQSMFNEANILPYIQKYNHPTYFQKQKNFLPFMSVIDLLFNKGDDSLSIIMENNISKQEIMKLRGN